MSFGFKKIEVSKEIPSIELLRGIASAMVCYFHLSRGNPTYLPDTSIVKQMGKWGWSGVEIFFVISGFVIPYSTYIKNYSISNFFAFLKKRIIRIEPPYLVSIVFVILLNFVSTLSPYYRGTPFHIDWFNVLSHLAYLNVFTGEKWLIDIYWTLAIEFQYYILIALTYRMITSKKIVYRLIFFLVFITLFRLNFLGEKFIFDYAAFFSLGILLFQYTCKIISSTEFWILTLITFGMLFYSQGLVITAIVAATLFIITYINKVPKFLRYLGLISYSLYLVHIPLGGRIINISETLIHSTFFRECMVFVAFFICIIFSSIFYRYIEKTCKRLSGSIKYNPDELSVRPVVAS